MQYEVVILYLFFDATAHRWSLPALSCARAFLVGQGVRSWLSRQGGFPGPWKAMRWVLFAAGMAVEQEGGAVSYTHLTLPTKA